MESSCMLPPDLPPDKLKRPWKQTAFTLILVIIFCSSFVAAAALQVQTLAPVNKSIVVSTTTPIVVGTTTPVPVRTVLQVATATPAPTVTPAQVPTTPRTVRTVGTMAPSLTAIPTRTLTFATAQPTLVPAGGCPAGYVDCEGQCYCGFCGQQCPQELGYACREGVCRKECAGNTGNGTEISCSGQCSDTWWDNNNCGECGHQCIAGETCAYGYCSRYCSANTWGDTWYPVEDWTMNYDSPAFMRTGTYCGDCYRRCSAGETCTNRQCTCPADPSHAVCNGVCTDISADEASCGACGQACGPAQQCQDGTCRTVCQYNQLFCNDQCKEQGSLSACGACGHDCLSLSGTPRTLTSPSCHQGVCRAYCNGELVSIDSHELHCGFCGNACGTGQICEQGRCVCTDPQTTTCGKDCVTDFSGNEQHCGDCEHVCGEDQRCRSGRCESCPWGSAFCSGENDACTVLQSDRDNCGVCGHRCPWYSLMCYAGQCIP